MFQHEASQLVIHNRWLVTAGEKLVHDDDQDSLYVLCGPQQVVQLCVSSMLLYLYTSTAAKERRLNALCLLTAGCYRRD